MEAPAGPFPEVETWGLAAIDADENGTLDLVTAARDHDPNTNTYESCLALLRGDGSGSFQPRDCVPAPTEPYWLLGDDQNVADVDSDGHMDLVTSNGVLFGDGTGDFSRFTRLESTTDAVVADFDGDGKPDIATGNISSDRTMVYLNRLP